MRRLAWWAGGDRSAGAYPTTHACRIIASSSSSSSLKKEKRKSKTQNAKEKKKRTSVIHCTCKRVSQRSRCVWVQVTRTVLHGHTKYAQEPYPSSFLMNENGLLLGWTRACGPHEEHERIIEVRGQEWTSRGEDRTDR